MTPTQQLTVENAIDRGWLLDTCPGCKGPCLTRGGISSDWQIRCLNDECHATGIYQR